MNGNPSVEPRCLPAAAAPWLPSPPRAGTAPAKNYTVFSVDDAFRVSLDFALGP
jgi:hypothetical protein